ncbi:MAG: hypothetical protein ACXU7D_08805, partial [Burkholderiaceae bacterium]
GGIIGGAAGAAGMIVAGPVAPAVGALVGAHIGSLMGSLSGMKESGEQEKENENIAVQRKSGMMVAVSTEQSDHENDAVKILQSLGAEQIERAEGTIADGDWQDFDPLTPPTLIN